MNVILAAFLVISTISSIWAIYQNAILEKEIAVLREQLESYKAFLAPLHREWDEMPDDWMLEEVAEMSDWKCSGCGTHYPFTVTKCECEKAGKGESATTKDIGVLGQVRITKPCANKMCFCTGKCMGLVAGDKGWSQADLADKREFAKWDEG